MIDVEILYPNDEPATIHLKNDIVMKALFQMEPGKKIKLIYDLLDNIISQINSKNEEIVKLQLKDLNKKLDIIKDPHN